MENFRKYPFTTFLGVCLALLGMYILIDVFVLKGSEIKLSAWYGIGFLLVGLMYLQARDEIKDILTLGLKTLIERLTDKLK